MSTPVTGRPLRLPRKARFRRPVQLLTDLRLRTSRSTACPYGSVHHGIRGAPDTRRAPFLEHGGRSHRKLGHEPLTPCELNKPVGGREYASESPIAHSDASSNKKAEPGLAERAAGFDLGLSSSRRSPETIRLPSGSIRTESAPRLSIRACRLKTQLKPSGGDSRRPEIGRVGDGISTRSLAVRLPDNFLAARFGSRSCGVRF